MNEKEKEIVIDIISLSFTVDTIEEVKLAKIFDKEKPHDKPSAYSVSWNEWIKGGTIQAQTEPQTYRVAKLQRFENYELARVFFLDKVNIISQSYKEV
jgi:hypothetical protein